MDDDEQTHQKAMAMAFPNPPTYLWLDFTPEKLQQVKEHREKHGQDAPQPLAPHTRLEDLPEGLEHLQPPAEPTDGRWRIFGDLYTLSDELPSLEEQGIQRLCSDPSADLADRAFELKKIAKSLMLNFLELTDVLATDPEEAEDKVGDLRTLFINMHHGINEWRPHQTREALITLLTHQLERTKLETKVAREATENTRQVLERLGDLGRASQNGSAITNGKADDDSDPASSGAERAAEPDEARDDELWKAMDD